VGIRPTYPHFPHDYDYGYDFLLILHDVVRGKTKGRVLEELLVGKLAER
jgi:hypothetical protein